MATTLRPDEEKRFQTWIKQTKWYSDFQKRYRELPNLDDPSDYDYRKAWKLGLKPTYQPEHGEYRWPDVAKGKHNPHGGEGGRGHYEEKDVRTGARIVNGVVQSMDSVDFPELTEVISRAKKRVMKMSSDGSGQPSVSTGDLAPIDFPTIDVIATVPKPPKITEPPEEKAGLWGKAVKGVAAAVKTPLRLIGNAAQVAGYASMGDTESMADVPTFLDTAVKAYHDSAPSVKAEVLTSLQKASVASAQTWYGASVTMPKVLGHLSVGDVGSAGAALREMDKPIQENMPVGRMLASQFNELYPELGPGVTYIVYQKGKKTMSAKVSNANVRDRLAEITNGGGKIIDTQTMRPDDIAILTPSLAFHPNDVIAFSAELADPLMAGIFGKATNVALKGLPVVGKALQRVPGAVRAIDEISAKASKMVEPGTPLGKLIDQLETNQWTGITLTKATKGYRARLYPMSLQSRAVQAQLSQQSNAVTELIRGTNPRATKIANDYINAIAAGDTPLANNASKWLVNHGLVNDTDILSSAKSIVRIADQVKTLDKPARADLERLAYEYASGDTTQASLLARIEQDIADGVPVDPLTPEVKASYKTLRTLSKKEAALGLEPGDIKVLANALTLPRGGLGIISDDVLQLMDDYAGVLKGRIPAQLNPTKAEMTDFLGQAGPTIAAMSAKARRQILAGFKAIDAADGMGVSSFALDRMRKGLRAAANTDFAGRTDLDDLVAQVADADRTLQTTMAPGPRVKPAARQWAARVRKAVDQEAEASGFDPEVVHNMARMARDIDHEWGRLEVDLGIINEAQFERMRGIHLRRMYDFDNIEARLQQLEKTDPVRAGELRTHYETNKATLTALNRAGMRLGGIGTSISKARQALTPEFREWLDEVNNISDAVLLAGNRAADDISEGMLYRAIAKSNLTSDTQVPGWVPLLTKSSRARAAVGGTWGDLEGKWVPKVVASDLERMAQAIHTRPSEMLNLWTKYVIAPFKKASVVYYPIARMHNTISNLVAMHLGTGITDLARASKFGYAGISSMINQDAAFQRYARYSPSVREASVLLHESFSDLLRGSPASDKNILQRWTERYTPTLAEKVGKVGKTIQRSMSAEETTAKMMMFHAGITPVVQGGLGLADREAVLLAEQWMIDYGNVPPIVDVLRRRIGLLPFITYSYKMVGNLGKVMAKNPEVMAKAWRNADALTELFDPGGVKRGAEQVGLPDWLSGKIVVRLPGPEPRYLNLDPYIPWSILNVDGNADAPTPIRAAIANLGQPFKAIIDLGTNVNSNTGAPIVPEGADPQTTMEMRTKYLLSQYAVVRQGMNTLAALRGRAIRPTGKPETLYEALTDIRNLDINREAELKYRRKQDEIRKAVSFAEKALNDNTLTPEKRNERFGEMMHYVDVLRRELLVIGDGLTQLAGLEGLLTDSGADPHTVEQLGKWFNEQNDPPPGLKMSVQQQGLGFDTITRQADQMIQQIRQMSTLPPIKVGKPPVPPVMREHIERMKSKRPAVITANKQLSAAAAQPTEIIITRDILPGIPGPK